MRSNRRWCAACPVTINRAASVLRSLSSGTVDLAGTCEPSWSRRMLWPYGVRNRICRSICGVRRLLRVAVRKPGRHVLEASRVVRRKSDVRNAGPEIIEVHFGIQEETNELLLENSDEQSVGSSRNDGRTGAGALVIGTLEIQIGERRSGESEPVVRLR